MNILNTCQMHKLGMLHLNALLFITPLHLIQQHATKLSKTGN